MVGDGKGNERLPEKCFNSRCPEPTQADFEVLSLLGETKEGTKVVWRKSSKERF